MSTPLDASVTRPMQGGPSFPLSHRLFRAAWMLVWFVAASWTPPQMRAWRRGLLRLFGADVAQTCIVHGSARIWYPPNLQLGSYACVGPGATIYCMAPIAVGAYAVVSQRAHICAGTHDVEDPHFQLEVRPITIGARAWIAAEAFVGPGVTVGEGAVLGARGVAFRDLDPWSVYAGNPARRLRSRTIRADRSVGPDARPVERTSV